MKKRLFFPNFSDIGFIDKINFKTFVKMQLKIVIKTRNKLPSSFLTPADKEQTL